MAILDQLQKTSETEYTPPWTVTDVDGNVYTTIQIGTQLWTVENWRSTKYADGTAIPYGNGAEPRYKWYNDSSDLDFRAKYGALYNWYVIDPTGEEQLAPSGWRVPTPTDWDVLLNYMIANGFNWDGTLTGNKIGKALASNGNEWTFASGSGRPGNLQNLNNTSGLSVMPSGIIGTGGASDNLGILTWMHESVSTAFSSQRTVLNNNAAGLARQLNTGKNIGCSVRLVRDIADGGGPDPIPVNQFQNI